MTDNGQYWAGVFRNNASTQFKVGGFGIRGVETPDRKFIGYNVYRRDEYDKMQADPFMHPEIKDFIRHTGLMQQDIGTPFTAPDLDGWSVIRTDIPLTREQMKQFKADAERVLGKNFYLKDQRRIGTFRDTLVMKEVYPV